MPLPSVSIIIPTYNHERFLLKALSQHLIQTVLPLEIIVIDDGSTDNSKKIIKEWALKYLLIRPIYLKKNQGIIKAVNKGIALAKGDYLFFSSTDDLVAPNFLEKSLTLLSKYPTASFSFSDPAEYHLNKDLLLSYPLFLSNKERFFSPLEIKNLLKKRYFTFPSNSSLFKRTYIQEIGGFNPSLGRGCDWFICFLLALTYGVCYIPRDLTWFCVRSDSYSSVGLKDSEEQRNTLYKIIDVLIKKYPKKYLLFKQAGICYEQSWRAFYWLAKNKKTRDFLTFFLIKRLFILGIWRYFRSLCPYRLRIFIRNVLS